MVVIIEALRRLVTKESGAKTETPSPSVFRLTIKIDGAIHQMPLPCGYKASIFNGNPVSIGIAITSPEAVLVEERHSTPPHSACYNWTIDRRRDVGHFTGKGFEPDGEGVEPRREITKGVYFNDRLTELHFPDGSISFS